MLLWELFCPPPTEHPPPNPWPQANRLRQKLTHHHLGWRQKRRLPTKNEGCWLSIPTCTSWHWCSWSWTWHSTAWISILALRSQLLTAAYIPEHYSIVRIQENGLTNPVFLNSGSMLKSLGSWKNMGALVQRPGLRGTGIQGCTSRISVLGASGESCHWTSEYKSGQTTEKCWFYIS
jgi:hypothetical protein